MKAQRVFPVWLSVSRHYSLTELNINCVPFCKRQEEIIEHVFYDRDIVVAFWLDSESYYRDECMNGHLKKKDVILGLNCNKSYININQNIIYAKY